MEGQSRRISKETKYKLKIKLEEIANKYYESLYSDFKKFSTITKIVRIVRIPFFIIFCIVMLIAFIFFNEIRNWHLTNIRLYQAAFFTSFFGVLLSEWLISKMTQRFPQNYETFHYIKEGYYSASNLT